MSGGEKKKKLVFNKSFLVLMPRFLLMGKQKKNKKQKTKEV